MSNFTNTCSQCLYFRQFYGEHRGECYGHPPVMDYSGHQTEPARVKSGRPACSAFKAVPTGETLVKAKQLETPGDAVKSRRLVAA